MPTAAAIANTLDEVLRVGEIPDYPQALNGLQLANRAEVARIAAAVDFSLRTIERAIASRANMLIVHHGMFWGGLQRITGSAYERLYPLLTSDIAVYAAHLPLDVHPELGNNALLARELGLEPSAGFARYQTIDVGVSGECEIITSVLADRARAFAQRHGGDVVTTPIASERVTRRWGICTGAGASTDTLREALRRGIDTLIVGEGPHHTAVEAMDQDLAIIYAGHYATETLGVCALARYVERTFGIPWTFLEVPTGL
jgi:dinuclear metal center YbgI/SA1388 family protein